MDMTRRRIFSAIHQASDRRHRLGRLWTEGAALSSRRPQWTGYWFLGDLCVCIGRFYKVKISSWHPSGVRIDSRKVYRTRLWLHRRPSCIAWGKMLFFDHAHHRWL